MNIQRKRFTNLIQTVQVFNFRFLATTGKGPNDQTLFCILLVSSCETDSNAFLVFFSFPSWSLGTRKFQLGNEEVRNLESPVSSLQSRVSSLQSPVSSFKFPAPQLTSTPSRTLLLPSFHQLSLCISRRLHQALQLRGQGRQ